MLGKGPRIPSEPELPELNAPELALDPDSAQVPWDALRRYLQEEREIVSDAINFAGTRRYRNGHIYQPAIDVLGAETWVSESRNTFTCGLPAFGVAGPTPLLFPGIVAGGATIGFWLGSPMVVTKFWASLSPIAVAGMTVDLMRAGAILGTWTAIGGEPGFILNGPWSAASGAPLWLQVTRPDAPIARDIVATVEVGWTESFDR